MTLEQLLLFGSATAEFKQTEFKEAVVAMSWAVAGVPESQQYLFD